MCLDSETSSETEICQKVASEAAVSSDDSCACRARISASVGICTA